MLLLRNISDVEEAGLCLSEAVCIDGKGLSRSHVPEAWLLTALSKQTLLTSETSAPSDSRCLIEFVTAVATPGATPPCIISAITPIRLPSRGLLLRE